jgi:hypothetical protein
MTPRLWLLVTPKMLLATVALVAIVVGLLLPGPRSDAAQGQSQIPMQEIGQS